MRKRAALISILLLGSAWTAGVAPVAAQVPEPPGPPAEVPKPKKPKPEKPDVPQGPKEPPAVPEPPAPPAPPEPPEPPPPPIEPLPPTDPTPPGGEGPPPDDGSAGPGGGTTGGGSGREPRTSQPGGRSGIPAAALLRAAAVLGEQGEPGGGLSPTDGSAARATGDEGAWVDRVVGESLGALEGGGASTRDAPQPTAAVADEGAGARGLPLALLAAGLLLVSVGFAVGVVRLLGGGEWHPPGTRPERS